LHASENAIKSQGEIVIGSGRAVKKKEGHRGDRRRRRSGREGDGVGLGMGVGVGERKKKL